MWPAGKQGVFVGRSTELTILRKVVSGTATSGRGRALLVDGEPGIGKSALLAHGLAEAAGLGFELGWVDADELSTRFPLRVMLDCLEIEARSADPRRVELAALLRGETTVPAGADRRLVVVERLVALVEQVCADTALLLVANQLQWADELSLLVWYRLARLTRTLPLVLVGAYRPVPCRPEMHQLRRATECEGGRAVSLGPLPSEEVTAMVAGLVGGAPGPRLAALVQQAAGNPRYVREIVDALRDEAAVTLVEGTAEISAELAGRAPASLAGAIDRRLGFLSTEAVLVLRAAALLGNDFPVADLAAVLAREASTLVGPLTEAITAGVVVDAGPRLSFRHPLIRQALYDAIPATVRTDLHRHAAQALAGAGAPVEQVAAHLTAAPVDGDTWVIGWLVRHSGLLADRAPHVATELFGRALDRIVAGDPGWTELAVAQVRVRFRLGLAVEPLARQALAAGTDPAGSALHSPADPGSALHSPADPGSALHSPADPAGSAELCWILSVLLVRAGCIEEAHDLVRQGLGRPVPPPPVWRVRLHAWAAVIDAYASGESTATEEAAQRALGYAHGTGDRLAIGCCLFALSVVSLVRRDQATRLGYLDRALRALGNPPHDDAVAYPDPEYFDPEYFDLRLLILGDRAFALHLLDRFAEAEQAVDEARELARRGTGHAAAARVHLPAAVIYYCSGRWDDALAELSAAGYLVDNPRHATVAASLAALIAGHRDDRAGAIEHLGRVPEGEHANCGFRLTARALLAERDGQPEQARDILAVLLRGRYSRLERHLLLPHLVRMALAAGDRVTARAAAQAAELDAEVQANPGRVAASAYCRGLLDADPELIRRAVEYFQRVGRVVDLAQAREELAVAYALRHDGDAARCYAAQAREGYARLGAVWAVRRSGARLRWSGVRLGLRGPRRSATCGGWSALSPAELTIARLVAQGRSNPDIANELMLSRRTVQSHVSSILAKLHARTRVEIAREALQHL